MTILFGAMCFLVGQIVCIRRQAEQASAHNQRLLTDLQVAHRRLQDQAVQLEELAVVHERSRLARELHDSVTQTVFSMTLAVQTAQVLLAKDVSRVAAQLDRVVELARNASREIQTIVKQLRPASIAEKGLAAALRDYLAERQARDGLSRPTGSDRRSAVAGECDAGPVSHRARGREQRDQARGHARGHDQTERCAINRPVWK